MLQDPCQKKANKACKMPVIGRIRNSEKNIDIRKISIIDEYLAKCPFILAFYKFNTCNTLI